MHNIGEHSYDYTNESNYSVQSNRISVNGIQEDLLPIESSDGYNTSEADSSRNDDACSSIHRSGGTYRTEEEFQTEINKLKLQSSSRFKDKWEEILLKYSQIDDEKESDEIDLASGKIITDNGHLKSLRSAGDDSNTRFDGDIWSETYNIERVIHNRKVREARIKQKKKDLKQNLKNQMLFHNVNLQQDSSPLKGDNILDGNLALSSEDNLLSLHPSPTKKFKVSPTKGIRGSSTPGREGDISLVSPTKRKQSNLYGSFTSKLHFDDIPNIKSDSPLRRHIKSQHSIYGPTNQDPFIEEISELHNNTSSDSERNDRVKQDIQLKSNSHNIASSNESNGKAREYHIIPDESSESGTENDHSPKIITRMTKLNHSDQHTFSHNISHESSDLINNSFTSTNGQEMTDHNTSLDFEDQFLIVTDPYIYHNNHSKTSIFKCVFDGCYYCTGNKSLFQSHLLDKHKDPLNAMGYPVHCDNQESTKIPENTVLKLAEYFPLVYKVPPIPSSKLGEPFICRMGLKSNESCQKFFLSMIDLAKHQENHPFDCSSKKQVLLCPMLGCGYMTDIGYLEWRSHFIEQQHHIHPRFKHGSSNAENDAFEHNVLNSYSDDRENMYEETNSSLSNLSRLSYILNHIDIEKDEKHKLHEKNYDPTQDNEKFTKPDIRKEIYAMFSDAESDLSISDDNSDGTDFILSSLDAEEKPKLRDRPKDNISNLYIKLNVDDNTPNPLHAVLETGHESIEELFDD